MSEKGYHLQTKQFAPTIANTPNKLWVQERESTHKVCWYSVCMHGHQ